MSSASSVSKMGFWAVLTFVISSQMGSGVFVLPHTMSCFGPLGLFAWGISGAGALFLALVFSKLLKRHPETGGPHIYVMHGLGRRWGFYVAFTYWVLAWLSSAPVLGTIASGLCVVLGLSQDVVTIFVLESLVLLWLTLLNLKGVEVSGRWEVIMSIFKTIPLVVFPIAALFFFQSEHFVPFNPTPQPWYQVLSSAGLMTLWGFLGIEAITAPAGSVVDPQKTIPRALICGTLVVLALYVLNMVAVMGVVSPAGLATHVMPYGLALENIIGPAGGRLMGLFVVIVCLGAMNAWIMAMGQVAKGAADVGFFPPLFAKENANKAPYGGIIVSSVLLFVCLFVLMQKDLATQIRFIIDVSVVASIGVYGLCIFIYLKGAWQEKAGFVDWFIGLGALVFCAWMFWGAGHDIILWALLLPLAGVPFEYWWKKRCKPCVTLS